MSRGRRAQVGLAVAAVGALGALLAGVAAFRSGGATAGSSSTTVGGDNSGCIAVGSGSCQVVAPLPLPTGESDQQIADGMYRASVYPRTPAPFKVLFDENPRDLFIRSNARKDGYHIGLTLHGSDVWVDCVTTSDFNADPSTPGGPRWYRVHWPTSARSNAVGSSSPSDPPQGWAFAYYLRPDGSNGKVPPC